MKTDRMKAETEEPRPRLLLAFAALVAAFGAYGASVPPPSASGSWPVLREYAGANLRRVKMPLGGIGTGTVSLHGRGALVDWSIRNEPAYGWTPVVAEAATGFWLRTEDDEGRVSARILEGPPDDELYDGDAGGGFPNHGFPRFRSAVFRTAYPLAQVALADDRLPVSATLEAMNPLVPGDAEASGIPAALLRWRLVNRTSRPVKASVLGFLANAAGGEVAKSRVLTDALDGVSIGSRDETPTDTTLGRLLLALPKGAGETSAALAIADFDWKVHLDIFWKQFVATGKAADSRGSNAKGDLSAVALSVAVELPPGGEKVIPFVLAWRFPHRAAWSGKLAFEDPIVGPFEPSRDVGNWYAARYPTPEAAAERLFAELPGLEAKTVAFVRRILAAKAPDIVKEAALFNLANLRTETCYRTADGNFLSWEGISDRWGCCYGNCTHVWGYEHALVDLWPALAKNMTDLQFGVGLGADGGIVYRLPPKLDPARAEHLVAADGQLNCLIKAYENWRKSGDDAWMRALWPKVRRATEFCWVPGGWDADADGVMEGRQHNTMDVEYFGPNPQMEFLYLAALKAVAEMADFAGDAAFAAKCRALAAKGAAWTEANLFNGAWYEHRIAVPKGPFAARTGFSSPDGRTEPDFQLGAGCLVDQLLGDVAARHVGLGPVADETHARTTLATILARCASANQEPTYNRGRDFAFPDEPSLKMAWYPKGRMPKKPFPYYCENMTGFEYVVAAGLAQLGEFAAAEKVVRDIRARYDGRKRNPFDETESGRHYVRALSSWTVLKAFDPKAGPLD